VKALAYYPVHFGFLHGQEYPFYGSNTFSVSTEVFGDAPDFRYAYAHYRLAHFPGLKTRIPTHMDEKEALVRIRELQENV
jgi:diadenosine tetraphosphatase ApaH/serine/threonine PP2A family protein phosphatase